MKNVRTPIYLFLPFTLSTTLLAVPAIAEQDSGLEEILVTAQKRSESLTKVPIAIDVLNEELIENNSASELSQIENAIPSLNFGRGGRKTRGELAIRGVSDFARNIGTGGRIVVYIDDVPLGRSSAFDMNLLDVKQIEVLKGPQGTLFGANTIAGAINIITQEPEDSFGNKVKLSVGNRQHRQLSLKTNVPFSDSLAGSLQISRTETEGHIDNIVRNSTLMEDDSESARIKLKYQPTEQFKLLLSADWLSEEIDATNSEALADDGTFNGYSAAPATYVVAHDTNEFENREIWGSSLKANYQLESDYEITSISAYRRSEFEEQNEEDYSALPAVTTLFDEKYKQFTQELRLTSPINDKYDYVVGVYLSDNTVSTNRRADLLIPGLFAQTPASVESELYAVFANTNYRFTPKFEIGLGARFQRETKELDYTIIDTTGLFTNDSLESKKSFSTFLPKLNANYHINDESMSYVSISRGAKSGGWNADFLGSLDGIDFDQEFATNYELGYKSRYFDDALTINLAGFITKFKDYQVFQFQQNNGTTLIKLTNAAEATSKGLELELKLQSNEYFQYTLNASYTKAKFDEFRDGGGIGNHYDDNDLPYAPELVAYTAIDFNYPIANGTLLAHLDYTHSDGSFSQPSNGEAFKVDSYHTMNARLAYEFGSNWSVALWGRNITDEEYLRSRDVSFLGISRGVYEKPRTLGLSVKFSH